MSLFKKQKLSFNPIDPLGDGLREAIEASQRSPEAIRLQEDISSDYLQNTWEEITHDIKHDPEWFQFAREAE